jgi:hypothetical protein
MPIMIVKRDDEYVVPGGYTNDAPRHDLTPIAHGYSGPATIVIV